MSVVAITQDRVLQIANSVPANWDILMKLGDMLKKPEVGLEEVVTQLKRDTALAARLIRSANSPVYAQAEPVASVEDAVSIMGYVQVHRLVGFALLDQFSEEGLPTYGISSSDLRENSLFAALLMEELAAGAHENPRNCYTIGLLRSIGKVVLNRLSDEVEIIDAPERIQETGVAVWERSVFGITNNEAAAMILKMWRFPHEVIAAIGDHYFPEGRLVPLTNMLHIAAGMADLLGHGLPGESAYWTDTEDIFRRAGLGKKQAEAIIDHALASFNKLMGCSA